MVPNRLPQMNERVLRAVSLAVLTLIISGRIPFDCPLISEPSSHLLAAETETDWPNLATIATATASTEQPGNAIAAVIDPPIAAKTSGSPRRA
jgi:hypothetical protein